MAKSMKAAGKSAPAVPKAVIARALKVPAQPGKPTSAKAAPQTLAKGKVLAGQTYLIDKNGASMPNGDLVFKVQVLSKSDEIQPAISVFHMAPLERILCFKTGISARHIDVLASRMGTTKELLTDTLRLSRATINRKARQGEALSQDESERVLGLESLIGQVQVMIEESGNSEGFDAASWVATWLQTPLPALNGERPAVFMDSIEGQKLISNIVAVMQSGAYA